MNTSISVRGASEHNLKSVDLEIPRGRLVVVSGVSGSGKSSLAFDTICAEGRRRYLETFSSYARQFLSKVSRPAVLYIEGLSPAVAVNQSSLVRNPRSTVGTLTELYDLLRLLWARAGSAPANCQGLQLERRLFSFNSPQGACPRCKGLGVEDRIDPELLVADPQRTIREGALRITTPNGYLIYSQVTLEVLDQVCRAHGFTVDQAWNSLTDEQREVVLGGSDRIRIPYGKHPLSSRLRWGGITAKPREEGVYKGILPVMEQILRQKRNRNILRFVRSLPCSACHGSRLRQEALAVSYRGRSIAEVAALSIDSLRAFFAEPTESAVEAAIGREVIQRCDFLQRLGLGHLSLDRESTTLSGGEARRLRLARLGGVGLGGMLYVFDEPSVGLHHHDTGRLLEVLHAIRDRGNTVLVVEHDEQLVRGADWVVDVGPGPGADGGEVLFSESATDLASVSRCHERSRTWAFLAKREQIEVPARRRQGTGELVVEHLSRHNLRDLTVTIRLGALNVITGVSGAGKSTLVGEMLDRLANQATVDKVIAIDQAPIGRTPRSNPATYTGLFDRVRELFAAEPEAAQRGFGKGRFSFNVKGGRCETCEGAGVQQIGMQFLGTVSVVCEACAGRRFNEETLAVRHRGHNIHQVLELPIQRAAEIFTEEPAIARALQALQALGLGYLRLGHPATELSGGEAQRVKLAAELAHPATGHTLYVLDEPTTGLHSADLKLLLRALEALVDKGNTVLTVEHHLDLIKVADWVVDLGPGGGEQGGRLVAMGTPEDVAEVSSSHTGVALRGALSGYTSFTNQTPPPMVRQPEPVRLLGVTTHNLQHLDVEIPASRLTVITGVSGSGKSSLAFDTLFAEGQRRFADSLSSYARQLVPQAESAELEQSSGLTPTIAISQHSPSRNPRSSVATVTEIHDHYRLLFARAGRRYCPRCGTSLGPGSCACGFVGVRTLTASMFSPNSESGACSRCKGLGHVLEGDPAKLVTDPSRPLAAGALAGHKAGRFYGDPHGQHMAILAAAGRALGIDFSRPWAELDGQAREVALRGAGEAVFDVDWDYVRGKRRGTHHFQSRWPGLLDYLNKEYERKHGDQRGEALESLMSPVCCCECSGHKLRAESLAIRFAGINIAELLAKSVQESLSFFAAVEAEQTETDARELAITRELRVEIKRRLARLHDAGLDYLSLDRAATSLSGGEAQRVRLATQLGSGLTGITYVLDEPTIGLHPRDTGRLLGLLRELRDAGNTVVVVEHDLEVIAAADQVIEMGPGAGSNGGRIVAQGPPASLDSVRGSRIACHLRPLGGQRGRKPRRLGDGLSVRGAVAHNLRALDVVIPTGGLVAVTGVSGSGKSSLVFEVLAPSLKRVLAKREPVNCRELLLHSPIAAMVRMGRLASTSSPSSSPATTTGLFDELRELFASSPAAQARGLTKQAFSTQQKGGRCETCEGIGQVRIGLDFLPDVWVTCEDCGGRRFGPEVLACTVDGRNIADLLEATVEEACRLLPGRAALELLAEVGLGYLRLGQQVRTLSGGERQRLQLAVALLTPSHGPTLYLLDEPTTGLHPDDVSQLLAVFDRLIEAGHSLLVIEHNLQVISTADWIVDLGPEGGAGGGQLVAAGPPRLIADCAVSHTGRALRTYLEP